jgi:23S rRNA (guanosine2251-2'-O)-methyltransferase
MDFIIGRNPVHEALKARTRRLQRVLVADGVRDTALRDIARLAEDQAIPIEKVERRRLDELVPGGKHQGIVALTEPFVTTTLENALDSMTAEPNALVVVLDHIQDPQNFGAILRTAEGAGVRAVVVPKRNAAPVTPAVVRASAGATEHLPIVRVANIAQTLERLKEAGFWVVGASTDSTRSIPYTTYDFQGKNAIVVGSEGFGLARLVAERCDTLVHIPMRGRVASLNASVAAGVLLYEAVRQQQSRSRNDD